MSVPRILHIASWYPSLAHPTLGNFVEQHIKAIALYTQSRVLHAAPFGKWELHQTHQNNIKVTRVYYKQRWPVLSLLIAYRKGYQAIKKDGFQTDLIHLHVAWPAGLFCIMLRRKFVITEHYSGYHPNSPKPLKGLMRWAHQLIIQRAESVYPVSRHLAKAIERYYPAGHYYKVSNVVDTSLFQYSPSQLEQRNNFVLLHISTLIDEIKNFSGLLRAFNRALQQMPNLELHIGGDGDLTWLNNTIKNLNLPSGKIFTFGTQKATEVSALMQKCDAFVLFSRIENQPVVLLESMCCGRPVIATRVGGISEEVNGENGILVDSENETALTQAIIDMVHNYASYNLKQISKQAQQLYSQQAVGMAYLEAYQKVLES